jgi:Skp family chaperone for outer membrane proteins
MKSLSALLIFAATSVFAAAPNVAVVDVAEIMAKYNKAIEIKAGIDKSLEASRAAVNDRAKEIDTLKADFDSTVKRANDPILNEAGKKSLVTEANVKREALQQRLNEFQQFAQSAQGQIQQRANQLEQNVIADIRLETDKIAKAKNLQLIIPKAVAFTADPSLDITAEVIKGLNSNYKSGSAAEAEKPATK